MSRLSVSGVRSSLAVMMMTAQTNKMIFPPAQSVRRLSAAAASFIAAEELTVNKYHVRGSVEAEEPRPGPEVEQLEAGAGGEAGAELGEGLLVPAHTVPLEVQPGEYSTVQYSTVQ